MAIPTIPALPLRSSTPEVFNRGVEDTFNAFPPFVAALNAVGSAYALAVNSTSTTSNTIGTGSKSFTVQTGLGYMVGMSLRVANTSLIYMTGEVTSYVTATGALVLNITASVGSGTYTSWSLSQAAVGASAASSISSTATGGISSTNVQSALAELDSEKLSNSAGSVTGTHLEDIIVASSVGSATQIPVITYDANGRITSVTTASKSVTTAPILTNTLVPSIELLTSIPSWCRKIKVVIRGLSTNGTSSIIFQMGTATAYEIVTYTGVSSAIAGGTASSSASSAAGFEITTSTTAAYTYSGAFELVSHDGLDWCWSGQVAYSNIGSSFSTGYKVLGSALTRLRVTTEGGANTFDAGSIYTIYEG